jgi:hypothetical protein
VEKNAKKCHFFRVFVREKTDFAKKARFFDLKNPEKRVLLSVRNPLLTHLPLFYTFIRQ